MEKENKVELEAESPLLVKVRENFGYFGLTALGYGLLFTFCLYRNWIGILVPFAVAGSFAVATACFLKLGIAIKRDACFLAGSGVLLGFSTCMTANPWIHLFNYTGFFLLFCVFVIHQMNEDRLWGIFRYLKAIGGFVLRAFFCLGYPFSHCFGFLREDREGRYQKLIGVICGVLAAIPILAMVVYLLSGADMVFAGLVKSLFFQIVLPENLFGILGMFSFGTLMMYVFLCCACLGDQKNMDQGRNQTKETKAQGSKQAKDRKKDSTVVMTVTVLVAAVYLIFSVIQMVYLFAGLGSLPQGVTYAEYARQGFFQLLFVAFFNLLLVLWCLGGYRGSWGLRVVLSVICGCTFVMIASAFYRMCLYVKAYQLTFLRVLVLWFLALLIVWMAGVTVYVYRETFGLFRFFLVAITCFYLVLSFARPDSLIARYNIKALENGQETDLYYMTHMLSADAAVELEKLKGMDGVARDWVEDYFEEIEDSYRDASWRQWNASYEVAIRLRN